MSKSPPPTEQQLAEVAALAAEFDQRRNCAWNFDHHLASQSYDAPDFRATAIPAYASLGSQCYGTLLELALLHTLRPCKDCGSDHLYKSGFQIACCSCFGDRDIQCEDGCCKNCAENMNLPDAITRWNLLYTSPGEEAGQVVVIG